MKKLILNTRPSIILLIGIVCMSVSHLSYSVAIMGWVSMVPFLVYLKISDKRLSLFYFFLTLLVSWSLIVLKIISYPIPIFFVFLYSLPIAIIHIPGYVLWRMWSTRKYATLLFASSMSLLEWIQYTFTPLGSWGALAYTQVDNIAIAQTLSLGGMPLLSFVIYFVNAEIANYLTASKPSLTKLVFPSLLVISLLVYGHFRLSIQEGRNKEMVTVAAVGTESTIGGLPLPDWKVNEKHIEEIIDLTIQASKAGARWVIWNEASFYLTKENEGDWIHRMSAISKENNIAISAAYVIPFLEPYFHYENKSVLIDSRGEVLSSYLKHEPVPGEPAIKGSEAIKSYRLSIGDVGTAICYDFDFPYIAKLNKQAGANIIALPSSDWRGIDPLHTKMAAFRAIEQGVSIIRSTRFGLSACINPLGSMNSKSSSLDNNQKLMMGEVPTTGVPTFYSFAGDWFIFIAIPLLLFFPIQHVFHYRNQTQVGNNN